MKKVKKIKRVCKTYGKDFEVLPCRVKEGKGLFCSRSCAMIAENNPNWVGGKIKQICQICGNDFEVLICRIKEGRGKYCSAKCLGIANGIHLQEKIKGDKNPNWKGGISTLTSIARKMLYPIWIYPILVRDNFMCQKCNSTKNLVVHHLRSFAKIVNKILEQFSFLSLDVYDERLKLAKIIISEHQLEDGITLCSNCHKSYHKGRKVT